ncbi:MAG: trypsin-like peptidase domain-containing protein [Oscillospiraceae bacterium]|nr:trypsin-like peptidase domain-containing protein [Oscillospiraceae bacterium]
MYENNYNYIDVPEQKKSGAGKTVGKTVAMLLAVAVVGGASGFGGAYLHDTLMPAQAVQTTQSSQTVPAVNTAAQDITDTTAKSLISTTAPSTGALTTQQVVKKVSPSVVSVHSSFGTGGGTGTGIVLTNDGYIITNAHVVQTETPELVSGNNGFGNGIGGGYDDIFSYFFGGGGSYRNVTKNAEKVTVVLSEDDGNEYEAEIVGADKNSDIAVLKINAEGLSLQAAEFGDSNALEMGDTAIAIGYPLGMGLSVSQGVISGLNRTLDVELSTGGAASMTLIQTDTPINAGNSGGPLVNAQGQVVGITSSKLVQSSIEGMAFAIPITDAMPIISDLMNKGYVTNTTPQIGITGSNINNKIARYYGLPVEKGVMVVSVTPAGGAEAAGIAAGDVIVAADGKEISNMEELTEIKSKKKIGDTMILTLARAAGNTDVEITLTGSDVAPEMETAAN